MLVLHYLQSPKYPLAFTKLRKSSLPKINNYIVRLLRTPLENLGYPLIKQGLVEAALF